MDSIDFGYSMTKWKDFFLKKMFPAKVQHYVLSNVKRGDREDQVFRKNICLH